MVSKVRFLSSPQTTIILKQMARIRTIKPEFWQDEKLSTIPIEARLLFIGCWNIADDSGVLRGSERFIKSQLFPYDDNLRVSEVKKWIDALVKARFLIPLTYNNESYLYIRTFNSHQKIEKPSKTRNIDEGILNGLLNPKNSSTMEPVEEGLDVTPRLFPDYSPTIHQPVDDEIVSSNSSSNGNTEMEKIASLFDASVDDKSAIDISTLVNQKFKMPDDPRLKSAFSDFVEMRKAIKKPMTDKAKELMLKALERFAPDNIEIQIKILNKSIANSWSGVYPLKNENNGTKEFYERRRISEPKKHAEGYGKL